MQKCLCNFGQDNKKAGEGGAFSAQKAENHSNTGTRLTADDLSYPESSSKNGLGFKQLCYLIMIVCWVQVAKIESHTHWYIKHFPSFANGEIFCHLLNYKLGANFLACPHQDLEN